MMWTIIGHTKAAVFPEPVLAIPITSRPDSPTGTAWAWIAVGWVYPIFRTVPSIPSSNPQCAKLTIGCRDVKAEVGGGGGGAQHGRVAQGEELAGECARQSAPTESKETHRAEESPQKRRKEGEPWERDDPRPLAPASAAGRELAAVTARQSPRAPRRSCARSRDTPPTSTPQTRAASQGGDQRCRGRGVDCHHRGTMLSENFKT